MASAEELRNQISQNRAGLREALQGADGKWEQAPGGEEWTPKQIAEHVVGAEVYFANKVSEAMQGKKAEFERQEIASSADALTRLEVASAIADKTYRYVEDRDLTKAAEPPTDTFPKNIEGLLANAAHHLQEHAEQLRRA
ncbi:MAG: DinB family protein [Dehalococcoidia bacterium]